MVVTNGKGQLAAVPLEVPLEVPVAQQVQVLPVLQIRAVGVAGVVMVAQVNLPLFLKMAAQVARVSSSIATQALHAEPVGQSPVSAQTPFTLSHHPAHLC